MQLSIHFKGLDVGCELWGCMSATRLYCHAFRYHKKLLYFLSESREYARGSHVSESGLLVDLTIFLQQ